MTTDEKPSVFHLFNSVKAFIFQWHLLHFLESTETKSDFNQYYKLFSTLLLLENFSLKSNWKN